jgi:hypothetical protein
MLSLITIALAAAPITLASPEFDTLNVTADVARFCNEHLAQQLEDRGIHVATARQISALLGLERQKQLMGCSDDSTSCVTELANALGADGVLLGDLGQLGTQIQVNIKVVKSSTGRVAATWSRTVRDPGALLGALSDAADELKPKILGAWGRLTTTRRQWPLVPTLIGAGLAVAGAVTLGLTLSAHDQLVNPAAPANSLSAKDANDLQTRGEALQWTTRGAFIGAGVALGTAAVLYLLSAEEVPVSASLGLTPGGGALVIGGTF